jgi:predicted Co/Zn/Cd cation transporter (cation efflux family)
MTEANPESRAGIEQRALWIGAWSGLAMGALGFVFGTLTGSEAILLDGVFSLVGFAIALATIRVARVIHQPADSSFQFGYSGFEPLITMGKGIVIGFVAAFALASSVGAILAGGRAVQAGYAALYAAIATGGCGVVAVVLRSAARRTGSALLELDVRNWIIDCVLSAAVGVAFLVAFLVQGTSLAWVGPYVDPGLVVILVVFVAPMPVRVAWQGFRELMGGAPDPAIQDKIRDLLAREFATLTGVEPRVRMLKAGRLIYLQVYLLVPVDTPIGGITLLDEVRGSIHAALSPEFPDLKLDVIFTGEDGTWLASSIGGGPPHPHLPVRPPGTGSTHPGAPPEE